VECRQEPTSADEAGSHAVQSAESAEAPATSPPVYSSLAIRVTQPRGASQRISERISESLTPIPPIPPIPPIEKADGPRVVEDSPHSLSYALPPSLTNTMIGAGPALGGGDMPVAGGSRPSEVVGFVEPSESFAEEESSVDGSAYPARQCTSTCGSCRIESLRDSQARVSRAETHASC